MSAVAELLADRGEAAFSEEFFRSPPFLRAEGCTHSLHLRSSGGALVIPLIVRQIPDTDLIDAISPYGYPGGEARGVGAGGAEPLDLDGTDWSTTGLVSVFVRDRPGEPLLVGGTERGTLFVADPALPPKSRPSDRQQIRRNLRDGYRVERVEGPAAGEEQRRGFERAYAETMRRAGAAERYLFPSSYFESVLTSERTWLLLALDPEGQIAAGSIAVRSDDYLHYYLSGTRAERIKASPMKNIVAEMCAFAAELEVPLNLGGGVRPGDALEEFKRGFANSTLPARTHEIVCDRDAYVRLAAERENAGDFFPAYRAPGR